MKLYLIFSTRVLLGCFFLVTGLSKLSNLQVFAITVKNFGFTSGPVSEVLAVAISSIECVVGLLLLLGLWTTFSSGVAAGLLIVFIAAIIPNLAIGNEIECGCFGPISESKADGMLLLRDTIMLGLMLTIFVQQKHLYSIDHLIKKN